MILIPYADAIEADARSREMWDATKGPGWRPGNVTTHLYGVRSRTGDKEADAGLPDGIDAAIVVSKRGAKLDRLIVEGAALPYEAGAVAELYPAWEPGSAYEIDDLCSYGTSLYRVRQVHTSQVDWTPGAVLSLFTVYRKDANTLLDWVASEPVLVGTQRDYGGSTYECLQAHVTQSDWTPPNVPALWEDITPSSETDEWAVGVAYVIGDIVTYEGVIYKCRQPHTSIASWNPPTVLALWLPL